MDVGEVPTPTLQYAVKKLGADGGIMITASHNPPEYIGIKLVDRTGVGISREKAIDIENDMKRYATAIKSSTSLESIPRNIASTEGKSYYAGGIEKVNIIDDYVSDLIGMLGELPRTIKVVFDGSAGVGSRTIPVLLREMGAKVLTVNSVVDGNFTWRNPEPSPENIKYLSGVIGEVKADLGIAVDGDADRVVLITREGEILPGDKTFALVEYFLPDMHLARGKEPLVVTTIATSNLIFDVARMKNLEVEMTKVGDPYVSEVGLVKNALLGGEENGGVIYPWWIPGRDSGMTVGIVSRVAALEDLKTILDSFPKYYSVKTKIKGRVDYSTLKSRAEKMGIRYVDIDGVKLFFEEGWVLVRNSGTEPIVRIFTESTSHSMSEKLVELGVEIAKQSTKK